MRSFGQLLGLMAAAALGAGCGGGGAPGGGGGDTPLTVTTSSLPGAMLASAYLTTLAATGGTAPYAWSLASGTLPPPLNLQAGTGQISGTPAAPGTSNFTVRVTDAASATAIRALSIVVSGGGGGSSAYTWMQLAPTGTAPASRASHAAAMDPGNARMVVTLGSTGSTSVRGDNFSLALSGTPAWSGLPTGPSGRWGHSMVRDTLRNRMLLFGGNVGGFQTGNDLWQLTLATGAEAWAQVTTKGATAPSRLTHGSVYDAANDRLIIFGGGSGTNPSANGTNDVWALALFTAGGPTWSQLAPTGTLPAGRIAPVCVYDANSSRMILFGGDAPPPTGALGDVWALDLSTPGSESWSQITPTGTAPAARRYAAGAYDATRDMLVFFGGENGTDLADVWQLSLTPGSEAWTAVTPNGTAPAARDSHTGVYDAANHRIVFYGGFTRFPSTPFTDVWALDLPTPPGP